jgi:hypothetical protein
MTSVKAIVLLEYSVSEGDPPLTPPLTIADLAGLCYNLFCYVTIVFELFQNGIACCILNHLKGTD